MKTAEQIEALACPACGRKTLHYFQDLTGAGAGCRSLDCLGFFELDEIIEDAP
jgi:uncharacterized protein YbaR (Trm112 family)